MATLEVHDSSGRVQFVELTRDHPVLFGTSSACDVVLQGEFIRPVHGRIRWKSEKFKVEASPDAEFVLINGHKMTTGSIRQGDEITVGDCRMFLIRAEEDDGNPKRSKSPGGDDRTRVAAPPVVPARTASSPSSSSRRGGRPAGRDEPPSLERDDWLDSIRTAQGKEPGIAPVEAPLKRGFSRRRNDEVDFVEPEAKPKKKFAGFARLAALWGSVAPGREKILTSPLVIGLVVSLVILVGLGFWLKSIISSTIASRTFDRAVQNFDDGDYRTAMRDFDSFLKDNPRDARAGKAQVLRSLANVRQYVTAEGGTWSSALEAANEMVEQVGALPAFRDEQVNLAELIIKIGEGLADRARLGADAKSLGEAETVVGLHARVAGEPAPSFLNKSKLPSKLTEARAAVRKAQIRAEALGKMDQAVKDSAPSKVYDARDALVEKYPDLVRDKDVVARMTTANELIRKAVTVEKTGRPAEHASRPEALGPATSLVLRTSRETIAEPPAEEIIYAVADGYAYAIHGLTGAPLWNRPLGLAAPFAPQPIPGDATAVAIDARYNELVRLDARTGALKWRLALGEVAVSPPLVLGNQLAQVLPGGKLLLVGLESGELQTTVNLGRPLARSPVNDDAGLHLYILGRQDCLFVLAREPLSCTAVVYLGHADASVPCAPARLGRFLIVPENDSLYNSQLHIMLLDQDGAKVKPVQDVNVSGWTWQTPSSAGPVVWGLGDKGGYEAFSVGDYTSKEPFHSLARLTADSVSTGPAFALVRSDRELWVASAHSGRYDLDLEKGTIDLRAPIVQPGPAQAPIQKAGKLVIMTFQDQASGGVALWAIDTDSNAVVWKTVVGAPWPVRPSPGARGGLSLIGRDGREVELDSERINRGGFLIEGVPKPGEFSLPAGRRLRVQSAGKTIEAIVPQGGSKELWVQDPAKPAVWQKTALPVAMAAEPIAWGGGVLLLGQDARAYLLDPLSGTASAEPFVPKFDRDHQGSWLPPAAVDRDTLVLADDVGHIHRVSLKTAPVPRLVGEATTTLPQQIVAGPVSTGGAVVVVTADRHVRALVTRDLSPVGSWALEAPLSGPPAPAGDGCFVTDRAGGVVAVGRDGARLWSINLKAAPVGLPLVQDKVVWFLTSDGNLHIRNRSDGAAIDKLSLGILPDGGLLQAGKDILVSSGRGTIRPVTAVLRTGGQP
jgi:outer membrane protein assembly factor BamB